MRLVKKLETKCTSFKVSIVLELLIVSLTVPTPSACTPPPKPSRRGRWLVSSSSNNSFWQHMWADAPLSISHLVSVPCVFSNAEAVMLSVGVFELVLASWAWSFEFFDQQSLTIFPLLTALVAVPCFFLLVFCASFFFRSKSALLLFSTGLLQEIVDKVFDSESPPNFCTLPARTDCFQEKSNLLLFINLFAGRGRSTNQTGEFLHEFVCVLKVSELEGCQFPSQLYSQPV
ncbi:hypothetical protein V1520DRAFT_53922 [Lipomyces starkeyi]